MLTTKRADFFYSATCSLTTKMQRCLRKKGTGTKAAPAPRTC